MPLNFKIFPERYDTEDKKTEMKMQDQMGTLLAPVNSVIIRRTSIHGLLQ